MEIMEIKTERLLIRKIIADDWTSLKRIWDDFRESDYAQYDVPHKSDENEIRSQISKWAALNGGTDHLFFAVCLGDEVIGYIVFHNTGDGYDSGYCFHSAYHGRGYARESFQALIRFLADRGVRRLTAGTALNNIPSLRLLESLGFAQTGTEKVSFYKDESGRDIYFDGGIFELKLNSSPN